MMNKKTIEKRTQWVNSHSELEVKPSMNRRKEDHDYNARCVYMITICVEGHRPLFGTLRNADASHPNAWIEPSKLGLKVLGNWSNISIENPGVKTLHLQLMPDHVHFIIFVTDRLPRHLGHIVSRLKAKVTASYHLMSEYSETKSRTSTLWQQGYNDRILTGKGQLDTWVNYLKDNPRRLWVKRNQPNLFTIHQNITITSTTVAAMGNVFLLDYPYKIAVQCSRSMSSTEIEAKCRQLLSKAKDGAVLVSPCISPGEKEIMKKAFEAGFPLIILLENGFSPRQKPSGRQFDACAEGRLLLVAPWPHHNQSHVITRQQCLALNKLAEEIVTHETTSHST